MLKRNLSLLFGSPQKMNMSEDTMRITFNGGMKGRLPQLFSMFLCRHDGTSAIICTHNNPPMLFSPG